MLLASNGNWVLDETQRQKRVDGWASYCSLFLQSITRAHLKLESTCEKNLLKIKYSKYFRIFRLSNTFSSKDIQMERKDRKIVRTSFEDGGTAVARFVEIDVKHSNLLKNVMFLEIVGSEQWFPTKWRQHSVGGGLYHQNHHVWSFPGGWGSAGKQQQQCKRGERGWRLRMGAGCR